MKSPRFSLTITPDLGEAAALRRQSLRYRTLPEYIVGLVRTDIAAQPDHTTAEEWAAMPARIRDDVDAKLLAMQRQEAAQRRAKAASNPSVEISDDVLGLLDAYAKQTGQPLDVAANEILARFLYAGAVIA